MKSKNFNLTNDPRVLSLKYPTMSINIDDIELGEFENDENFTKRYIQFLTGKKNVYITRLSISKIKKGFYKRDKKKWKYIVDSINQKHLSVAINDIRIGNRLPLHIYHNMNKKCSFPFVCPDDVIILEAYNILGIKKVPVIILGSKQGLEESAFIQKMYPDINNKKYFIYSTVNFYKKHYYSLVGEVDELNIIDGICILKEHLIQLKSSLYTFHLEGDYELHYHEMQYSIILRTIEMLESMRLLLIDGFIFQASMILRSLYELSLNFYVSWLSPYEMTQMLQISSTLKNSEWEKVLQKIYKEQLSLGLNQEYADNIKEVKQYQYNFVNKVIEKARLSPLGEQFYNEVYTFLSDITHHDFSMVARYKNALEHGDEVVYDKDILSSILKITDVIVSMIYTRMKDDIGININKD